MIRNNGTGQDGYHDEAVGSHRTSRLERTHGSVVPPQRWRRPRRLRAPRLTVAHSLPLRRSRRGLSTVWPCAQGEHRDGTGLLADWLLTAVVKIVTSYTEPGQRVLLLAPPPGACGCVSGPPAVGAVRSHGPYGDLYIGLHEAAWTVVRLGRGIRTHTASPLGDPPDAGIAGQADPPVRMPELDGHIGGADPAPADIGRSDSHAHTELAAAPTIAPTAVHGADSPDLFDLIITTVAPHASRWMHAWGWDGLLTPHGTLTVITHSDRRGGWLVDPTGSLVHHVRRAGLTYRDHVALLRVPVRQGALDTGTGSTPDTRPVPASAVDGSGASIESAPVHSDLLVFTKREAAGTATGPVETSDSQ
jgi:hypothetical protein